VAEAGARLLALSAESFWRDLLPLPGVARNLLCCIVERFREANVRLLEAARHEAEFARTTRELEVAREIQASMSPAGRPLFPEHRELEAFGLLESARHVGGDFLDAFLVGEDRVFLTVGDVAGKGVPAALYMARSLALLHREALRDLPLVELLSRVNSQLCEGNASNLFLTVFCATLDLRRGEMRFVNGGHPSPLILAPDGRVATLPRPRGMLVGAFADAVFDEGQATLRRGETLLLYSDGLTEAMSPAGMLYGAERVDAALRRNRGAGAQALVEALRADALAFAESDKPTDDLSLLVVRYRGRRPAARPGTRGRGKAPRKRRAG
jgi:serine phosphatase RsbU (regulator of sigma subunit)